ncbi:hypothetical protein WSK_1105 [Novosphingobium sp. Rr 2-17]|uniref:DUF2147 domain-containing protein n=1 Tax=Novosphingobium sp. Rr 2-17 TaxID=555793 RepID=UPI000269A1A5|nr:hypothetical protein WSK_1105 [Novosphingobium sp. Rr 2-17]
MRPILLMPVLAILSALAVPAAAQPGLTAADAQGVWMNPKRTVAVNTAPCGPGLCGRVAWGSPEARADAKDSGLQSLVGTQLLENYRFHGNGVWTGTVYVPDLGRHFYSEIDQLSGTELKVKGCVLGGLICKSQVWTRIQQVPA